MLVWHVPSLFDAALRSGAIHALQHAGFFFSAVLFWWACLQSARERAASGATLVYLFTTMVHTGALGALIAFAK